MLRNVKKFTERKAQKMQIEDKIRELRKRYERSGEEYNFMAKNEDKEELKRIKQLMNHQHPEIAEEREKIISRYEIDRMIKAIIDEPYLYWYIKNNLHVRDIITLIDYIYYLAKGGE